MLVLTCNACDPVTLSWHLKLAPELFVLEVVQPVDCALIFATIVEGKLVPTTEIVTVVLFLPLSGAMLLMLGVPSMTVNVALPPLMTVPPLAPVFVFISNDCDPARSSGQLKLALPLDTLVVVQPVDCPLMFATIVEGRLLPEILIETVLPVVPRSGLMLLMLGATVTTVNAALPPLMTVPPFAPVFVFICND